MATCKRLWRTNIGYFLFLSTAFVFGVPMLLTASRNRSLEQFENELQITSQKPLQTSNESVTATVAPASANDDDVFQRVIRLVSLQGLKSLFEKGNESLDQVKYLFIVSLEYERWYNKLQKEEKHRVLDELSPLKQILELKPELSQVMGQSDTEKLICTLDWKGDTVIQYSNYSTFKDGNHSFEINGQQCNACDLLPDSVLTRLTYWLEFYAKHTKSFGTVGVGVQMWFALENRGTAAHCPGIKIKKQRETFMDVTCNNLGSQWDACFPRFYIATGIKRIVTSDNREAWLTCVWSHTSITSNASFACYNLLHEYLVDSTEALDKLGLEYRLVAGTLLGAARNHDMIPWTPDVDIGIILDKSREKEFAKHVFQNVPARLNWSYSTVDCDGIDHFAPLRLFPSCPVLLKTRFAANNEIMEQTQIDLIKTEFSGPGRKAGDVWRQIGYVDVYYTGFLARCQEDRIFKPFENVTIRGRVYKGLNDPIESSRCVYGSDWDKPPQKAHNFLNYKDN